MFLRTCYMQCCLTEREKIIYAYVLRTVEFLLSFLAVECICVFTIFFLSRRWTVAEENPFMMYLNQELKCLEM